MLHIKRSFMSLKLIAAILASFSAATVSYANNVVANPLIETTTLHRQDGIEKVSANNPDAQKPQVKAIKPNDSPNRITSTLKQDPHKTRAFHWFTSDSSKAPVVLIATHPDMKNSHEYKAQEQRVVSHYLERDNEGYFIYKLMGKDNKVLSYFTDKGKTIGWEPKQEAKNPDQRVAIDVIKVNESIYTADAKNLKPNTQYYYQVGDKDGKMSQIGQFKTAGDRKAALSFIQYTDTQNAYWNEHIRNEAQFAADTLRHAQKINPKADFVLHTGDIVEIAEVEDEWVDLMAQSQAEFLKMSLVPVPGNHDEFGLNRKDVFINKFNEHFNVDKAGPVDGGSYYSFDYNNAHFIVLNTNDYKNPEQKSLGKEQLAWLREDVKKARKNGAQWVILSYHKPLFSKSYHSLEDEDVQNVREDFMQAIDELDIDIALQGHDHVFSRTKSLNYAPKSESFVNAKIDYANFTYDENNHKRLIAPKGTTFIIPNTAGTKAYDSVFDKPLEHLHKVRPKLSWLTQQQVEHYNSLFEVGYQPQVSERFKTKHENYRDSSMQNFAIYHIDGNLLTAEIYQVSGDLSKNEQRKTILIDKFSIQK